MIQQIKGKVPKNETCYKLQIIPDDVDNDNDDDDDDNDNDDDDDDGDDDDDDDYGRGSVQNDWAG